MKIAIDSGPLSDGNAGRGIGVYTKLLAESLVEYVSTKNSSIDLIDVSNTQSIEKYDIVHFPYFDFFSHTLKVPAKTNVVVTVHDTIPLIYPEHYPPGVKGKISYFRQKRALQHVSAVVTDSETSKKDIVRFLGIAENNVTPIYLAPTIEAEKMGVRAKDVLQKYGISYPFVLYVGDVNWNKNLVRLAESCERIKKHLVVVGKRAASDNYDRNHVENMPLLELQTRFGNSPYIHRIGFVLAEELPLLMKNATLLCQPSYYEGFGLSVLDAMSIGIPTVCAKTQALVELYESASVFFDPYDVRDMSHRIKEVFENKKMQAKLTKAGLELSKQFSWKKTAEETFQVYVKIHKKL